MCRVRERRLSVEKCCGTADEATYPFGGDVRLDFEGWRRDEILSRQYTGHLQCRAGVWKAGRNFSRNPDGLVGSEILATGARDLTKE